MTSWFKRKIYEPLIQFLRQGATPTQLAWAVGVGLIIAFIPIFGSCTILCLLAIWLFKLNPAAVLLVNQVAYPLQFLLYLPLIRMGEWIFSAKPIPFSPEQIVSMVKDDVLAAIGALWTSTTYALVAWLLLSIPAAFLVVWILTPLFGRMKRSILVPDPSSKVQKQDNPGV